MFSIFVPHRLWVHDFGFKDHSNSIEVSEKDHEILPGEKNTKTCSIKKTKKV